MQKSLDVLSYFNSNFLTLKTKVLNINDKESLEYINEMDKGSVLHFKLSNNNEQLIKFFDFLAECIGRCLCPKNKLNEYEN